ncbi:MAG: rod shape-determining protein MreC [Candidatus Staskawiczbacteria bacterium]|nr:rod shape-determining protein MreC [Candidatus Staskawiczbacteria bacterium]
MNVFLNKRNAIWPKILIGIIVFLILIGILNLFQKQFKNFFYFISEPLQKTFWNAGSNTSNLLGSFLSINNYAKENEELNAKNQELLNEIISLQQAKAENQALREAANIKQENKFKIVLADVVGVDSYQDFILINKGSDDGILENMPVINEQKVLFGKIFKVYNKFSKVMLVSNQNSVLDIKIQKDDEISPPIYGIVRGRGNFSAFLDTVPLDSEVKNDDILITSSLEGVFPRGLLVGKITEVYKDDLKPFQTAKIELLSNLKQIDKLFVITDYNKEK